MPRWNGIRVLAAAAALGCGGVMGTGAARAAVIADSIADFPASDNTTSNSKQGIKGWSYGYWNGRDDTDGHYAASEFIAFPDNQGPGVSAADFWTGSGWDWYNGNPPWDTISNNGGHPNGSNQTGGLNPNGVDKGGLHWVIRRWVSDYIGPVAIDWFIAKSDITGGNGVTLHLFVNDVELVDRAIAFNNSTGVSGTAWITLSAGDTVDLALDPTGTDGQHTDGNDSSRFSMTISSVPEPSTAAMLLAAPIAALRRRRNRA